MQLHLWALCASRTLYSFCGLATNHLVLGIWVNWSQCKFQHKQKRLTTSLYLNICYLLYDICQLLPAICYMLYVTCYLLHAICYYVFVSFYLKLAPSCKKIVSFRSCCRVFLNSKICPLGIFAHIFFTHLLGLSEGFVMDP